MNGQSSCIAFSTSSEFRRTDPLFLRGLRGWAEVTWMLQSGQLTSQADLTRATEVTSLIWWPGCSRQMIQITLISSLFLKKWLQTKIPGFHKQAVV